MELEERLYTSTEVAEILGVSLRSIYRYLDEGKIDAEVKTATGRHRFTKQNILDFLYPKADKNTETVNVKPSVQKTVSEEPETAKTQPQRFVEEVPVAKAEPAPTPQPAIEENIPQSSESQSQESVAEDKVEEPVDWLAKFREAAEKHKAEVVAKDQVVDEPVMGLTDHPVEAAVEQKVDIFNYYRSGVGGLKDIAQNLDKSAKKASLDYAFTLNAGLSLHKPIRPFSLLHAYVRPEDKEFFEKMLQLSSANKDSAQLCLILSDDSGLYKSRKEMHGLYVVSDVQLKKDLMDAGEVELARDFEA